jgi:hypothetical protein
MGYYFIYSSEEFEKSLTEKAQILWVGDDALKTYLKLQENGLSKWPANLTHHVITFDGKMRWSKIVQQTSLNDLFPLWEEHYTLKDLLEAFCYLKEECFKDSYNDLFVVGNPGELVLQGFIHFLTNDLKGAGENIKTILLSDPAMKIAFEEEITSLKRLLLEHSIHTIEIAPESFDWGAYIASVSKESDLVSEKKRRFNHL